PLPSGRVPDRHGQFGNRQGHGRSHRLNVSARHAKGAPDLFPGRLFSLPSSPAFHSGPPARNTKFTINLSFPHNPRLTAHTRLRRVETPILMRFHRQNGSDAV